MRHVTVAVCATILLLSGCGSSSEPTTTPSLPGEPDVYARIAAETDCAALQDEFDTADAAHERADAGSHAAEVALSYMQAADDRMEEVGCY